MTTPPLPDVPCVRCALDYTRTDGFTGGSRFYLSYSGSAPSGANCTTLGTDIGTQWAAHLAYWITSNWTLTEVDVLDIATHTGASAATPVTHAGTNGGTPISSNAATVIEYGIARRYRGGKPRMYLPPASTSEMANDSTWVGADISAFATAFGAFIAAIEALSIGSMGTLTHVNLSYYQGFTNHSNTSGRSRAVPTYRATALHDNVLSYIGKARIGSQRRRRSATTP